MFWHGVFLLVLKSRSLQQRWVVDGAYFIPIVFGWVMSILFVRGFSKHTALDAKQTLNDVQYVRFPYCWILACLSVTCSQSYCASHYCLNIAWTFIELFFSFLTLVLMLLFILTLVNHIIDVFIYRLSDKTFQILIFTQKLSSLIGCIKWCLAFEEYSGSGCRLSQPKIVYPYIWDSLEEQRGRGGWLNLPHFPANWTLLWAKFNYLMQSCYRFILDHGAT